MMSVVQINHHDEKSQRPPAKRVGVRSPVPQEDSRTWSSPGAHELDLRALGVDVPIDGTRPPNTSGSLRSPTGRGSEKGMDGKNLTAWSATDAAPCGTCGISGVPDPFSSRTRLWSLGLGLPLMPQVCPWVPVYAVRESPRSGVRAHGAVTA